MFYLLRPILFRTCRYFTGLYSSNIHRYFLDFAYMIECQCFYFDLYPATPLTWTRCLITIAILSLPGYTHIQPPLLSNVIDCATFTADGRIEGYIGQQTELVVIVQGNVEVFYRYDTQMAGSTPILDKVLF